MEPATINMDAFADGQIDSKLWLCEHLERLAPRLALNSPVIWLFGGWYAMTAFLLMNRDRLPIKSIRSLDIDPEATRIADLVNKNWEIRAWKFKAFTQDCNDPSLYARQDLGEPPQMIINTACEHFDRLDWWENIAPGTAVVLQATDQEHEEHVINQKFSLEWMRANFQPMETVLFEGAKEFRYPTRSFHRFMLIGIKGKSALRTC